LRILLLLFSANVTYWESWHFSTKLHVHFLLLLSSQRFHLSPKPRLTPPPPPPRWGVVTRPTKTDGHHLSAVRDPFIQYRRCYPPHLQANVSTYITILKSLCKSNSKHVWCLK
jgi:hypothetical protein